VLDVRIRASTGDIQVLCTPNHRFLIGRLWVPIGFAHFGQQVLVQTAQKGSFELGEIVKIRHMRNPRTVYNFLIFQAHNYIADGLIVHNRKIMGDFEVSEETRGLG
jgi:hypothetical protein